MRKSFIQQISEAQRASANEGEIYTHKRPKRKEESYVFKGLLTVLLTVIPYFVYLGSIVIIFFAGAFNWMHDDFKGPDLLTLPLVFAIFFVLVGTIFFARLPAFAEVIMTFRHNDEFYEVTKTGNSYSIDKNGTAGNAYVVMNFFINIIGSPIIILGFIISFWRVIFDKEYAEFKADQLEDFSFLAVIQIVAPVIAIVLSAPVLSSYSKAYNKYVYENNIDLQLTSFYREEETYEGYFSTIKKGTLHFVFYLESKTNDLEELKGDVTITDGHYTFKMNVTLHEGNNIFYYDEEIPINDTNLSENEEIVFYMNTKTAKATIYVTDLKYPKYSFHHLWNNEKYYYSIPR